MVSCRRWLLPVGQKCGAKLRFFPMESNIGHQHFDEAGLDFDELVWGIDGVEAWDWLNFFRCRSELRDAQFPEALKRAIKLIMNSLASRFVCS